MKCKLCGSMDSKVIYKGLIRDGGLGRYTDREMEIYQCQECDVIWHEEFTKDLKEYYESEKYRNELEGTSGEEEFYLLHDKESAEKFRYTGTTVFRNKIVADVGCACGAFLDYIGGVAKEIVAIEPSAVYRQVMERKGFSVYAYPDEACTEKKNMIDVVTSFDVIEHIEHPIKFMQEIYDLLAENGVAIIGTPTDAPVMRKLLGEIYEKKQLFSTQHLWVFSEKNLKRIARNAGFKNIEFRYYQRYGLDNLLGWLRDKKPRSEIKETFITPTLDSVWKMECEKRKIADYIVIYLKK